MRRTLPLVLTIAAETAVVVVLYRFVREPEFAVAIALGFATWLLASTVVYLAARLARVPAAVAAAGRLTLPVLRRRVDRALAASIMSGALVMSGAPAMAGTAPDADRLVDATVTVEVPNPDIGQLPEPVPDDPGSDLDPDAPIELPIEVRTGRAGDPAAQTETSTVPVDDGTETDTETTSTTTTTTTLPSSGPSPAEPATTPTAPDPQAPSSRPAAPPTAAPTDQPHTVVTGDNLWDIAARQLATRLGREPSSLSAAEIHPYWVRVCDTNRDRIRSGDVNLIDPGEVIELPPL